MQNQNNTYKECDISANRINTSQVEEKTNINATDIADTQDYIDVIMTEVIPSLMGMDSDMELDEEE